MSRKRSKSRLGLILFLLCLAGGIYFVYNRYILNKARLKDRDYVFIYIGRHDKYEDLISQIDSEHVVEDIEAFDWLARQMKLNEELKPGRYRVLNGMNARQIINLIRYHKEEKVKLSFNAQIHNLDEFVEYCDSKLELSTDELEDWLSDEKKLRDWFGLDPENALALVVPGVYDLSWSADAEELFSMLKTNFDKVWNDSRKKRARKLGYTIPEIATMASIVQCESSIASEQAKIAGVYFNRLEDGMLLQADPTLKFANKNYDAQRLLDEDKEMDSPYNTYKYKGLPPGPIALVSTQAIDATLNYTRHNYLFFCAKPGLNGYSDFSVNYEQHRKFAAAYQKALDERGINR
ncbi:MAG TPA: endolytic transglycosylase MltG [Bacteroidia bacterium]|nr:endolytic transglycosylase MltG [Bacteroidia bacterium]